MVPDKGVDSGQPRQGSRTATPSNGCLAGSHWPMSLLRTDVAAELQLVRLLPANTFLDTQVGLSIYPSPSARSGRVLVSEDHAARLRMLEPHSGSPRPALPNPDPNSGVERWSCSVLPQFPPITSVPPQSPGAQGLPTLQSFAQAPCRPPKTLPGVLHVRGGGNSREPLRSVYLTQQPGLSRGSTKDGIAPRGPPPLTGLWQNARRACE